MLSSSVINGKNDANFGHGILQQRKEIHHHQQSTICQELSITFIIQWHNIQTDLIL